MVNRFHAIRFSACAGRADAQTYGCRVALSLSCAKCCARQNKTKKKQKCRLL